jgi:hypothetical protein
MPLDAGVYREAAHDRAQEAFELYEAQHYAAAHYLAGLAVECMLYACRIKAGRQLDLRHSITILWREAAAIADFLPRGQVESAGAAVSTVVARWLNNHRYRSDRDLRQWLVQSGIARDQSSKDDPLKHSARIITAAALDFIPIGELIWRQL